MEASITSPGESYLSYEKEPSCEAVEYEEEEENEKWKFSSRRINTCMRNEKRK